MTTALLRPLGAEAAGTCLLVTIATGAAVAGADLGGVPLWTLAAAAFVAISLPVLLFVSVSGAHINPAVTLALWASGRFPRTRVLPYVAAQVAGAFVGSALVLLFLGNALHLGATVPAAGDWGRAMVGEFAFTFLLVLSVTLLVAFGAGPARLGLLAPGAVVAVATYVLGPITGCSLNPARTIAPAVLSGTYTDLWAYLIAVPAGALAAAALSRRLFPIIPKQTPDAPLPPGGRPLPASDPVGTGGAVRWRDAPLGP